MRVKDYLEGLFLPLDRRVGRIFLRNVTWRHTTVKGRSPRCAVQYDVPKLGAFGSTRSAAAERIICVKLN